MAATKEEKAVVAADAEMKDTTTKDKPEEETTTAPTIPPLVLAALRLEKSLRVSDESYYSNPAKVVRRWLSTSSGAASGASLADITAAAKLLLNPETTTSANLSLLFELDNEQKDEEMAVDVDVDESGESAPATVEYLVTAQTEVLAWLISLKVRLQWKSLPSENTNAATATTAAELCQKGILLIMNKLEQQAVTSNTSASSSLFPLNARLWRWLALLTDTTTAEGTANLNLRVDMAKAHNMALLRRDGDTAPTLLNAMLRDLLKHSQVEQAQKLLANSTFPTDTASNNQLCRYLYYSGRIQALRLEYTLSFSNLSQSLRKAPTNTALGFRIAAQRLLVVVQLLMGEIPERPVFFTPGMTLCLEPYLHITQAVRQGDLAVFTKVVSTHKQRLQQDETYTLISRLAHQVVKAGLRKLQVSYSRLSLQDVADRLGLANAKQAEFVVAKAVRDGVLDATIHHEEGYVQSHDLTNVYTTKEPAQAFHRRIAYCLTTHNDAVRAMRYPPDAYKKQLEASRGNRRRRGGDDKTDEEKAQELEDELDEDY